MLCPCHRVESVTDVNRSYSRFFAKCATNVPVQLWILTFSRFCVDWNIDAK